MMDKNASEKGIRTREAMYRAIVSYIGEHGYPSTTREIGRMVGLSSPSSIHRQLLIMKDEGMIETDEGVGVPRAIRVPGYKFVKEV